MEKQEIIKYWIETSENDLKSSSTIFESGKYDWTLFIAHLALEKLLKAYWVKNNNTLIPPKTHNLAKIAVDAKLNLTDEEKIFLLEVNEFNIETRYPDYKFEFYKKCTREFTENYLQKIKEFYKCIRKKI
ncbi:MAG: HEPN domain-containing protein [Ignavibacteriales bacterium]|nr:HEPN domain-containing protein [Ignavibacteriales bacterium]